MGERIVLGGGRVFDGIGAPPFAADVAIQDGRLVEIGADLAGDQRVDLAGRCLLPGFIDCHAHVSDDRMRGFDDLFDRTPAYLALVSVRVFQTLLDAGITTVRDAAGADAGHRDAVADGLIPGPRLLVSLMQLSPGGGPYDDRSRSGLRSYLPSAAIPDPVADGPEGVRSKVREYVRAGADVIKIFATGHFAMAHDGARRSLFTDAELEAIVDEAGRQGVRVMAHAHGAAGAAAAARAGVASIEHGFYLDDAAIEVMAEHGTFLVPTLLASSGMVDEASDDAGRERAAAVAEAHRAAVRRAPDRGVPIAMGTDCPVVPHGRNLEELELLTLCGLTPTEALLAATSTAARLLGLDDEIGTVAPGKRADLVVVAGDPLEVAGMAHRITDVYRDGVRVGPKHPD